MKFLPVALILLTSLSAVVHAQSGQDPSNSRTPVTLTAYDRTRVVANQWFTANPAIGEYGYLESQLRLGLEQRIHHWDWRVELIQPSELFVPTDAVSPVTAQGQLGLGATYYASNGNNPDDAAAALKEGYIRYHAADDRVALRLGRFEFFDGQETQPANTTLAWLQTNRIAQRLVGNFGFTTAQRSFDGTDAGLSGSTWNLSATAARATQGVFNMNANPELNVDVQYLAYTRYLAARHVQLRGFALGYHDGRTYITKTDNRPLAVRAADHRNIRVGSYGADAIAAFPLAGGTADLLFWGVLQDGDWGRLDQHSGAVVVEGGYRLHAPTGPWLRGGFERTTGDNNPADTEHNTFFQVLPTPRVYARFPFFNMMNSSDQYVQLIDMPGRNLKLRSDLHFLQLTSQNDLWYSGGGAYDNKVFGFTGRPANNRSSLATLYDVSADYSFHQNYAINGYYGLGLGRSVVRAIYLAQTTGQFGYVELVYSFHHVLGHASQP